jgi:SlyX protein
VSDERLEMLETKVAFLEAANQELSSVLQRHQKDIESLHTRLVALLEQLDDLQHEPREWTAEEEKPPHY